MFARLPIVSVTKLIVSVTKLWTAFLEEKRNFRSFGWQYFQHEKEHVCAGQVSFTSVKESAG